MSTPPESGFAGASTQFAEYAHDIPGYVRYEVVRRNLQELVEGDSLSVADIGGGGALDAIWLAKLGHKVVIVDPDEGQIAEAKRNLDSQGIGGDKVQIIEGTMADMPLGQAGTFDLVLAHGVAMYTPDPEEFVNELVGLAKAGGYISLLEKGYYGGEVRLFRQNAPLDVIQKYQARQRIENRIGKNRQAFLPEELESMLKKAGAEVLRWSGVRIFSDEDNRRTNTVDPKVLEVLIDAEYDMGKNPEIRALGQMLHFIAQSQKGI